LRVVDEQLVTDRKAGQGFYVERTLVHAYNSDVGVRGKPLLRLCVQRLIPYVIHCNFAADRLFHPVVGLACVRILRQSTKGLLGMYDLFD
jgi:hypothetical protein